MSLRPRLYWISFFIIVVIASFFRFYNLSSNPNGLFADEAAIGYNAYSIAHHGTDEYGMRFPLLFKSFGDYRLPVPIYASVPFIYAFGLSDFTVRLAPVFCGILTVVFITLAISTITDKRTGFLAGFLLAIAPWHIQYSRWGMEYIYFSTCVSLGLWIYFLSYKNVKYLHVASLVFGTGLYTYYPSLFITPIFWGGILAAHISILIYQKKYREIKSFVLAVVLFAICILPLLPSFFNGTLNTRWQSIQNFNQGVNRHFHIEAFASSYINHFSADFLFSKGNSGWPGHKILRESVTGMGMLYLFQLPLLLIGIFWAISKMKPGLLSLVWLLFLFPIGGAVTLDVSAVRTSIGVIPLTVLSAFGLEQMIRLISKQKKILRNGGFTLICFIILISIYKYSFHYFFEYPNETEGYWGFQYGAKDIMQYFKQNQDQYDVMYLFPAFNGTPIYFKFYDPEHHCPKCIEASGTIDLETKKRQLFALSAQSIPFRIRLKKIVYFPSGLPGFVIAEFAPDKAKSKL